MLETLGELPGVTIAVVEGVDAEGQPRVRAKADQLPRSVVGVLWTGQTIDWSRCCGMRVAITFEDGDEARPVVLGLLDEPPTAFGNETTVVHEDVPVKIEQGDSPETLHINSEKELVLQCGKAKIALRADGRVVIMGGYVLSRSTGVNKIKGGSVHIN